MPERKEPEQKPAAPARPTTLSATPVERTVTFEPSPALAERVAKGVCPHCGATLVPHEGDNPHTQGAAHCNACGGCFRDGALRAGHTAPNGYSGPLEGA